MNGESLRESRIPHREVWRQLGRIPLEWWSASSWRPGDPIQLVDNPDRSDLLGSIKDPFLRRRLLSRKMTAPEVATISIVSPFDSAIERLKTIEKESGATPRSSTDDIKTSSHKHDTPNHLEFDL